MHRIEPDPAAVERIAALVRPAQRVLVITGAGISADSGLPTYRGIGGIYTDATLPDGMAIEELLSAPTWRRDPELVWEFLAGVVRTREEVAPNRAHEVLAAWQERAHVVILTQNVDGLHQDAGSRHVLEVHGRGRTLRCRCGWREEDVTYGDRTLPPLCPACGAIARPDVVLFGEMLPTEPLQRLAVERGRGFDVVLSIGTSDRFPYIIAPVLQAARRGTPTVQINPGTTELSPWVTVHARSGAAATLGAVHDLL